MDDIQLWIYVIFGIIYFVARAFKKKPEQKPRQKPRSPVQTADDAEPRRERPKSFEELLEEFTGGNQSEEKVEEIEEPEPFADAFEKLDKPKKRLYGDEEELIRQEGSRRVFSDEESKKIYEESIKRAEGSDLEFERDVNFLKEDKKEEEVNEFAQSIRESLQNQDEAKKAIILSEILNRKY